MSWFAEHAFTLVLKMTGSMVLIPYLLVAAYGVQLAWRGETYAGQPGERRLDLVRGAIAALYAAGMIYAGGAKFLLLSALIYAPGHAAVRAGAARAERRCSRSRSAWCSGSWWSLRVSRLYGIATGTISV